MTACRKPIRVLIVEDSTTVRTLIEEMIKADPRLEILDSVASGEAAIRSLARRKPDVISMDIRLPGMSGLDATREIMRTRPTPIVVVAANVDDAESRISIRALRAGALSVVEKPAGLGEGDLSAISKRLCDQLVIMSEVKLVRQQRLPSGDDGHALPPAPRLRERGGRGDSFALLGIAASTGGPNALPSLFHELGAEFNLPVALVQHISESFFQSFVKWLDSVIPQQVVVVDETRRELAAGHVYLAPSGRHLCVSGSHLVAESGPLVSGQCPSGTVLFQTMASNLGARAVAVILTGMGSDGANGMRCVYEAGGYTIAESRETAIVSGMPDSALALGAVIEALPLPDIARRLRELTTNQRISAWGT